MVGPRNILLALAIVSAIAVSSENAAEEQEDHLDALELCLDPFPCRTSPYTGPPSNRQRRPTTAVELLCEEATEMQDKKAKNELMQRQLQSR